MSFPEIRARQQAAVFRTLGQDAVWPGVAEPVRVIPRERDDPVGFGESFEVRRVRFLRVRKVEVAAPTEGQAVELVDDGRLMKLIAQPRLDAKGVWVCEVQEVQP